MGVDQSGKEIRQGGKEERKRERGDRGMTKLERRGEPM